jgi:hypothetical protein
MLTISLKQALFLASFLLALTSVLISLSFVPSGLTNLLLVLFCLISGWVGIVEQKEILENLGVEDKKLIAYLLLCFTLSSVAYVFYGGSAFYFFKSILFLMVSILIIGLGVIYGNFFFHNLYRVLFLGGVGLLILNATGLEVAQNFLSAFFLPYCIYALNTWKRSLGVPFCCAVFMLAFVLDARAISLAIFLSVFCTLLLSFSVYISRLYVFALLMAFLSITMFSIIGDYYLPELNDLLTNRPVIWRYYYESTESFFFGSGFGSSDVGSIAADELQYYLGRGVGEGYGAHSFFVTLFYRYGAVSIIAFFIIALGLIKKTNNVGLVCLSSAFCISTFTSVSFGSPYIYSIFVYSSIIIALNGVKERANNASLC